jgi:hypothetical protein
MRRRARTALFPAAAVVFLILGAPSAARAQRFQVTGPNECLNCHDHEAERTWFEKQEAPEVRKLFPDKGANAGHINALKQLEAAKSNDFAKAIGLKDKYDLKGSCVQCHASVFSGDANAGVTCESCHGPASGYLKPHQTKGAYDQSVAQFGMTKLVGNLAGWAQQCTTCHVMTDKRLVDAGHPSGDDFDLGKKFGPVSLHFKKKYSAAEVTAIGRPQVEALVRKRGGAAAPAASAAAAPSATPVAAAAAPSAPPAAAAAPSAASAPPAAPVVPPPAAAPVAPPAAARSGPTAAPASAAAAPAASSPAPSRAGTNAAAAPVAPAAVSTIAPPAPLPPPIAPAAPAPAAPPAAASAAVLSAGSLPAGVALVQGKVISALTELLRQGASAPLHTSTPAPALTPYSGPDAALIELQRAAIALALETLSTAPAPPAAR